MRLLAVCKTGMGFVLISVSDMTVSVIGGSVGRSVDRSLKVIESDNVLFNALAIFRSFSRLLRMNFC